MAAPIFFLSTEAANGGVLIGFSFNKVTEVTNEEHHRRLLSEKNGIFGNMCPEVSF